jgi:CBS domain containing-hemolysin-like protein
VVSPEGLPTVTFAATISPLHLALCAAAVGFAGLGSMAAASLIGYSPTLLAERLAEAERPDRDAITEDFARRGPEYLAVAMTYTAIGWMAGLWALGEAVDAANQGLALALFAGAMLLVAGTLPVAITQIRAERTLMAVRPAVRVGWILLRYPLVLPLLFVMRLSLHVLRIRPPAKQDPAEVQKQVMAAVADTVTDDALPGEERTWIGNIVALKDMQVSAVMRPRPDIVAFPASMPLRQAVQQAMEHGFSRYPVYEQRIDEILGIFYVKDALRLLQGDGQSHGDDPVRSLVRDPLFVPETMGVAQLLRRFQAGHLHMAIVIDEYGTTAGLVSVEDVLEQIVGDIGDEYDSPEESGPPEDRIQVIEAGRVLEVPARTTVADLNRELDLDLPEDGDWETVAGLVIATCNRIPAVGETVAIGHTEFTVLAADERRLLRLRVTVLGAQPASEAG